MKIHLVRKDGLWAVPEVEKLKAAGLREVAIRVVVGDRKSPVIEGKIRWTQQKTHCKMGLAPNE